MLHQTPTVKIRIAMMRYKIGHEFRKSEFYEKMYEIMGGNTRSNLRILSYEFMRMKRLGAICQKTNHADIFVRMRDVEINEREIVVRRKKGEPINIKIDTVSKSHMFIFGGDAERMTAGFVR